MFLVLIGFNSNDTIRLSKSWDPNQARCFVKFGLGPNLFSAVEKSFTLDRPLVTSVRTCNRKIFFLFLKRTVSMKWVFLSIQKICLELCVRKYLQFYNNFFVYLNLCTRGEIVKRDWLSLQ